MLTDESAVREERVQGKKNRAITRALGIHNYARAVAEIGAPSRLQKVDSERAALREARRNDVASSRRSNDDEQSKRWHAARTVAASSSAYFDC